MALLSTNHKCTHPCLLLLRGDSYGGVYWRCCWVLGVRNPQLVASEVWSLRFQDKLHNSDSLLFVLIPFYVILLLIIHLWCLYMYETLSWHTYSYAFGFVLKTGCDMTSQSNQMSLLSSFLFFFLTMVFQDCRLVFYFCYINRNLHYLVRFVQKKSSHACCRIGLRVDLYEIGSGFHRFPQQTLVQELLICPDWKILLFRFSNETAIPELKSTFSAGWC